MSNKLEILSLFGFERDPFSNYVIETADMARVKKLVLMACAARAQISIVGDRGIGKTRAVNAVLREMKTAKIVRILSPDKSRITASDIQEALLIELAPAEKIRQDREIRVRQLRKILGQASQKGPVIVVLEEAHRLHGNTLRSLKNLRELDWMGETHLFTVILIGQSDSTQNIGLSEVRLRTEIVPMHGLTQAEITAYIGATVGKVFSESAIKAASSIQDARNYLDLHEILVRAMSNALAAGREDVLPEDLAEFLAEATRRRSTVIAAADQGKASNALRSVLNRKRTENGQQGTAKTA
jgi:type II secretory pathway predicted ATPase ExeA